MNTLDEHHNNLRAWARGLNPLVAATEMLIRAGYADPRRPWVITEEGTESSWIDFERLPDLIGGKSGGEKRFLRIAASIASDDYAIRLGDELAGLDYKHARLVIAGIAHAAGFGESTSTVTMIDGKATIEEVPPLGEWPSEL